MKKIIKYLALPISFSLIPTFAFTPALANSNEAMAPSETREARIDQGSQLQEKENLKPSGGQGEYSIKPQEGNWRSAGRLYPQGKEYSRGKKYCRHYWTKQYYCKGYGRCHWRHSKYFCPKSRCGWHHVKRYHCYRR